MHTKNGLFKLSNEDKFPLILVGGSGNREISYNIWWQSEPDGTTLGKIRVRLRAVEDVKTHLKFITSFQVRGKTDKYYSINENISSKTRGASEQ